MGSIITKMNLLKELICTLMGHKYDTVFVLKNFGRSCGGFAWAELVLNVGNITVLALRSEKRVRLKIYQLVQSRNN